MLARFHGLGAAVQAQGGFRGLLRTDPPTGTGINKEARNKGIQSVGACQVIGCQVEGQPQRVKYTSNLPGGQAEPIKAFSCRNRLCPRPLALNRLPPGFFLSAASTLGQAVIVRRGLQRLALSTRSRMVFPRQPGIALRAKGSWEVSLCRLAPSGSHAAA